MNCGRVKECKYTALDRITEHLLALRGGVAEAKRQLLKLSAELAQAGAEDAGVAHDDERNTPLFQTWICESKQIGRARAVAEKDEEDDEEDNDEEEEDNTPKRSES